MESVINIDGKDYHAAFDYLLAIVRGEQIEPATIDGKKPHDLQAFLKIMPRDVNLTPEHDAAVAKLFQRRQSGYFLTAWNLFHRIRQRAAVERHRRAVKSLYGQNQVAN